MGLFDLWREARGSVMRQELEDIMLRVRNANESATRAYFNNIYQTIGPLKEMYGNASTGERKALMKQSRKSADQMWSSGDWPSSLGLGISLLNVESEYVPGDEAAFVKVETDKIIAEAAAKFE
ncbi:MAG: hypothetical protein HOM51_06595 [Rhodospirillaceae bacterium]|nr:hypothetical protein [Rhodospirillaceae bacterium]